jgi:hypothetical protein
MGLILNPPVILDLGKTSRKSVRRLTQGRGKLLGDVQDALDEVRSLLGEEVNGMELVPMVLVYRRKIGRKGRGLF